MQVTWIHIRVQSTKSDFMAIGGHVSKDINDFSEQRLNQGNIGLRMEKPSLILTWKPTEAQSNFFIEKWWIFVSWFS